MKARKYAIGFNLATKLLGWQGNNRHNDARIILATIVDNMLALIQIIELLVNVAGEIRARVNEALDTEQEAFPRFKVDAHGPEGDLQLDNLSRGHLFLPVVWVVRDHGSAPFRNLGAVRGP